MTYNPSNVIKGGSHPPYQSHLIVDGLGPSSTTRGVNIDVAVRQVPSGLGESSHAHVEDVDDDSESGHEDLDNSDI